MNKTKAFDDAEIEPDSADCPNRGIYPDVDFREYCRWDAINHSKLCRIDKSPLNTQYGKDFSGSAAIKFGSLAHCGILEPDSLDKRYAVMPDFHLMEENTTAAGKPSTSTATQFVKQMRDSFTSEQIEKRREVISQAEYDTLQRGFDAVASCPKAVERLQGGRAELSIVWHDPSTGLRCKARIDYQREDGLADLKTSRDDNNKPLPESFEYALGTYSYYTQAAWYQRGWEVLTGDRLPFWFVVLGTGDPMQCVAAPVGEMSLRLGRDTNTQRMALYKHCVDTGSFPGYESPVIFELPDKYFPEEVSL